MKQFLVPISAIVFVALISLSASGSRVLLSQGHVAQDTIDTMVNPVPTPAPQPLPSDSTPSPHPSPTPLDPRPAEPAPQSAPPAPPRNPADPRP
ncbi:hypothetical protein [Arcticibacter sp.]|uniref:hypothetical protein n=1 Tax=Arcticibacter sp. TaxID=1872630 RepID=UPI00388E1FE3